MTQKVVTQIGVATNKHHRVIREIKQRQTKPDKVRDINITIEPVAELRLAMTE